MANIASNRSPSPLSSRNCRNSETNSTTRRSFTGNPFARPNALINPKSSNPPTPANTPTTTDHAKRNLITRKSTGSCSMFQDGKENLKDSLRSPAKSGSKNFMSPTISAASKFTPSPRKKILGEKNDLTRTSIQFLNKESDFKSESDSTTSDQTLDSTTTVEQKVTFVDKVTLISANDENENGNENEKSDLGKIRPFYCSPITSPIIAPIDADPHVPPYDPKNNFLSPRPQYLRYKPNPRIEILLNKDDYGEDDDVTGLQDRFNLSDENSSESEEEQEQEKEEVEEKEAEFVEKQSDSVNGSLDDLSEIVSEEKKSDSELKNPSNKTLRSKTVTFLFVMFVVACFSISFTDLPPMDLPIYNDINYSEVYHESLKFAGFAKESFDDLVENVKQSSIDFVSYLSYQKSNFFPTHNISPIQFFNLTNPSVQEEFVFNRHIGTDYIQEIQESYEEMENIEEETYEEMDFIDEIQNEIYVEDEDVTEEQIEIQIDSSEEGLTESKLDLEDGFVSKSESGDSLTKEQNEIQIDGSEEGLTESKSSLEDGFVSKSETQTETEVKHPEIEYSSDESETLTSVLTKCINTINLVVGFSMVILAATATSAIFYMNKSKAESKVAKISVNDDCCSSETSSSVQKGYNKKNNNRESMASSSSDFSMGSPSYGSFTTFERIPIKHGDEVMLTPIRRSSRLRKNQVISS